MDKQTAIASVIGAFFVPIFEFLYGEGETVKYLMIALLFFIALDWITGIRAAKRDNSYASEYGLDGIFRTFFLLLLPAGGHFLDMIFSLPGVVFGIFGTGVLYHVIQSMTANALRAGWGNWFPEWIITKVSEWVKSELESKINRAETRRVDK